MTDYNSIFEKFVDTADDHESRIVGYIAYGIYKTAKREWIIQFKADQRRQPNEAELKGYAATWTDSQVNNAKKNAAQVIAEFAQDVIDQQEPAILRSALRGRFWPSVWQSIIGAVIYTIILILLAIVLNIAGIDLLSILSNLRAGPA